jgi:anti-sigma factor ChrR (cupin superfamily)
MTQATAEQLNADFSRRVVVDTAAMDWQASPSATVWRKRLDLAGPAESGRVTSIVRYDADSVFPSHPHPDGEEFFVLEGTFSDEHGDYAAGTHVLNPEGFSHAPGSATGCVLFVKLRQYPGTDRRRIVTNTAIADWQPDKTSGVWFKRLYREDGYPERMALIRFEPGAAFLEHDHPAGEELFVLEGTLQDEHGQYGPGHWLRAPPGSHHTPFSKTGCTLYVKAGHLAGY